MSPPTEPCDVLPQRPQPTRADDLAQWRESALRAASRAYEAAYGREVPDVARAVRWRLRPRVAVAVTIAVATLAAAGWWWSGGARADAGATPSGDDVAVVEATDAADVPPAVDGASMAVPGSGDGDAPPALVHVSGAVASPGLVEVPGGARVADAVAAAGGLTGEADLSGVNLARAVADGEHVHVPAPGQQGDNADLININTADAAALEQLPGIGPVLAGRIVEDRLANGAFATLDDLARVSGVGPALLARWQGIAVV